MFLVDPKYIHCHLNSSHIDCSTCLYVLTKKTRRQIAFVSLRQFKNKNSSEALRPRQKQPTNGRTEHSKHSWKCLKNITSSHIITLKFGSMCVWESVCALTKNNIKHLLPTLIMQLNNNKCRECPPAHHFSPHSISTDYSPIRLNHWSYRRVSANSSIVSRCQVRFSS